MSEKYRVAPFYNGVSTFKAAFPQLSDAVIEWRERRGPEDSAEGDLRKTGFRRGNFAQGVLPCSNPACHEGGYEVDRLIADMLALGETERTGILLCSGRERGDEMRRGPIRCPHRIHFTVTLVPRAEVPREPKSGPAGGKEGGKSNTDRRRYNNRRNRSRRPRPSAA